LFAFLGYLRKREEGGVASVLCRFPSFLFPSWQASSRAGKKERGGGYITQHQITYRGTLLETIMGQGKKYMICLCPLVIGPASCIQCGRDTGEKGGENGERASQLAFDI